MTPKTSTQPQSLAIMRQFGDNAVMVRELELCGGPVVMGILNVTPDSFSDGGQFFDPAAAVDRAARMVHDGAEIIDVGGESSRPGAEAVPAAEQIRRTQPVIAAIHEIHPEIHISIDTQSAEVAGAAIGAGATMVNDISALRADANMGGQLADAGVYVVLMHMRGEPRTMQQNPYYEDVVGEIEAFLSARVDLAIASGIGRERIIIDPGIGFGKTVAHNLEILSNLGRFVKIAPVLLGTSRKSFLGKITKVEEAEQRLTGTIVTNTVGLLAGVRILRVHDVKAARQAIDLCAALSLPTRRDGRICD